MAKEYVPVFFDRLDVTQDLTAEEKGNLIDAVVAYASGQEYEHLLTGGCKIAFRFMKGQVDRNDAISETRSEARKNKTKQNETNDNKPEQTETKSPKENNNKKENDKENKNENKRFSPPSLDEVRAYCQERNNGVDAQTFVDFYASKGWKVGNSPMKDWKACVRTWEQRDSTPRATQARPTKTVVAQQYEQRDYSGLDDYYSAEQDREMEEWLRKEASS